MSYERESQSTRTERARLLWQRVEALWSQASSLSAAEQEQFVAAVEDPDVRRELVSMLEHATEGSFLEGPLIVDDHVEGVDPLIGASLGAYRVIEQIGMGGMGVVYRAERTDDAFDKQVAIKVLRGGCDPLRVSRFREERQILADIEHPKIARLIDGGTTKEGVPYVVMEYVRGHPITAYCRHQGLGLEARIRLFLQLCAAVDEAHRHLVVHRDIKPSNILVTADGALKLLDFGVAKLLEMDAHATRAETATQQRGLTPGYASPEQMAGGRITTGSDIYSLGIVLFELLAGCRPYEQAHASPVEMLRRAESESMPLPSVAVLRPDGEWAKGRAVRVARRLRGDLDNIVGKATRSDVRERYPSVAALALDLQHHLEGRPVSARVPSWRYRLTKLVRRHPVAVPLISFLVVAVLVLATYAALLAQQALRDRNDARSQQQRAEEVARFLEDTFRAPDPNAGSGAQIQARELVDRETARVLEGFPERPDLKARLLNTLGVVYQNLGQYDEAQRNFERALTIRSEVLGAGHLEVSETQADLAWLMTLLGNYDKALALVDQALTIQRDQDAERSALHAATLERRGFVLLGSGRFDEAEGAQRTALAIRQTLFGDDHPLVGASWQSLAETVGHQGRPHEAIEMADKAIQSARHHAGDDSLALGEALFTRGDQQFSLRDNLSAIEDYTASLDIHQRRLSGNHPSIGILLNNRARAFRRSGELDRAEVDYRAALRIVRSGLRGDHREVATVLTNLSQVLRERGRFDEALARSSEAMALNEKLFGNDHVWAGLDASVRAAIFRDSGRLAQAVAAYERALPVLASGPRQVPLAWAQVGMGFTKLQQGQIEEGEQWLSKGLETIVTDPNRSDAQEAEARLRMGEGKRLQGAWNPAEAWFRQAHDLMPPMPEAVMIRIQIERRWAEALLELGRYAEAARLADTTLEHVRTIRGQDHWQVAEVKLLQAAIAAVRGQPAMDKDQAISDFERYRHERGPDAPATRDALVLLIRALEVRHPKEATAYREALQMMDARRAARDR